MQVFLEVFLPKNRTKVADIQKEKPMIIPFLPKLTHFHISEEPIPTHRPNGDSHEN